MTGGHTKFSTQIRHDRPTVTSRQSEILDAVRVQGAVSVAALAAQFDVTHQTIRRDLRALQDLGLLQKGFGAAFASPGVARHGHDEREATLVEVKRRLVQALEEFLTPDATVFVGLGTTFDSLHEVAERHPGILIATPNLTVAHTCALNTNATVYVYGGYVRNKDSSVLTMSDESRRRFKFDVAIIGASAIDEQGAVLEFDPMEVDLVRDVLTQSRRTILVAHDEKFGRRAPHMVTTLAEVDVLISNVLPQLRDESGNALSLPTSLRLITA
ncbi:MAG TPA: DeoR/GlpR family DNA-binding transcription regulator [Devosia sp.]|uniref:DeoR/GlpR family DNA-binding transcription regulator n=1 Tax=Devosia sp. TaxID=1871048 RepID=UPI002DDCF518|nr:DeoR/GlpR family DNA-binding transcription regulator [Devosia sp.]HEV2514237.1 DeoR/GlpR family DNA-binding transcription regulator [Devosia sp.]